MEPDEVATQIGVWILNAIADTRLCGEVDDVGKAIALKRVM
jgi:hypothetical protein